MKEHSKGESDLKELTKAINLMPDIFEKHEKGRREKNKIIEDLKNELSDLSATTV